MLENEEACPPTFLRNNSSSSRAHIHGNKVKDKVKDKEKQGRKALKILILVPFTTLIITIIALSAALAVSEAKSAALVTSVAASALWCPDGWIGYREKCYYFSEAQRNWTSSKRHCSFLGASLIQIDNEQEKAFIMRYKGRQDAWIGLYRDPGQAWRWVNGTEIKTGFTVKGGGNCAYLNDEDAPSSSRCYTERHWICSKADVYIQRKENPSASRKCLVWEVQ